MKIDGIPLTESKNQAKSSALHNNYCNEELDDIEEKNVPSYPATNMVYISKNLYVEESVKVLE